MSEFETLSVKEIANSSEAAKAIFDELGSRQRYRKYTNLDQFKHLLMSKGVKVVDSDYWKTLKEMEKAGLGTIIIGRRGNPDRFIWNYNLKSVAQAAKDPATQLQSIENTPVKRKASLKKTAKHKRGRPLGSKNKKRETASNVIVLTVNKKMAQRIMELVKAG